MAPANSQFDAFFDGRCLPALQVPGTPAPTGNVREQSQQIQQQYKQALDAALQQPRPEPTTPE